MSDDDHPDPTEADRQLTNGAESNAKPGVDEVGAVSGEAEDEADDPDNSDDSDDPDDSDDSDDSEPAQPGADPADEEQIEEERKERLDAENRPEGAEVDNTDRDFDAEKGMYTDAEGYEEAEEKFPPIGEQGA